LKSVDGIGDRSVYGLPDEKGVVIVNAGSNSLFSKSGFMNRDVIRTVQGKIIGNIQHLMEVFRSEQGTSTLSIQIVREQKIFNESSRPIADFMQRRPSQLKPTLFSFGSYKGLLLMFLR